jgi:hypothetical protein
VVGALLDVPTYAVSVGFSCGLFEPFFFFSTLFCHIHTCFTFIPVGRIRTGGTFCIPVGIASMTPAFPPTIEALVVIFWCEFLGRVYNCGSPSRQITPIRPHRDR